ncbi:1-(5-phosphoribosyl)-5-[(5-phosphoribosylamino)methylideneamino]imidazole-4-carboxamide isomerase [Elusimicrobiota bacterium]
MIIIPAVDIKGGRCVRLLQGESDKETVYSDDPLRMAKRWCSEGAQRLHLVDLDGAFEGSMKNMPIILDIVRELDIPVQVGGGIRDLTTAQTLLDNGVARIILGTSAVWDKELLSSLIDKWPDRISVGIDSRDGKIAVEGWKDITDKDPVEVAKHMAAAGVTEIIVTDIKTDGMLKGPNIELVNEVACSIDISVIASGGVTTLDDIKRIITINTGNIRGIIIGKALYTGDILLKEALKLQEEVYDKP